MTDDLDFKIIQTEKELELLLRKKYEKELSIGWEVNLTTFEFKRCKCSKDKDTKNKCECESLLYFKTEAPDKPDYVSDDDEESIFNDDYDDLTEEEKSNMTLVSQSSTSFTMNDHALRWDIIGTVQRRMERSEN